MVSNNYCSSPPAGCWPYCCACLLWAQSSGHLTVGRAAKGCRQARRRVQAKIPVSVQTGYHVNSNTPSDDYLIPLKLTWTAPGALEGGEVTYPKPALEKYEFCRKPLSVYTGNFDLVVSFKVAANAPAGPGVAEGKLRYQACSTACFPPKTVEMAVPYQVQ